MTAIEELRKSAECNLCKDCFPKYKMLIEPSISNFLLNPIDDWREVESNINQMVMITEGVFKGDTRVLSYSEDQYFEWEDDWRLIKFLQQKYYIDWIKIAKIKRDKNIIKIFTEKNNLSLRRYNEKTKVSLKIDDGRTDELVVKKEKNRLKIYKESSNDPLDEEFNLDKFQDIKLNWSFPKKINNLHKKEKGILRDCSYRLLMEANEVRNKIHDPSIIELYSRQDLYLFSVARKVTFHLLTTIVYDYEEAKSTNIKSEAEKLAKEYLSQFGFNPYHIV